MLGNLLTFFLILTFLLYNTSTIHIGNNDIYYKLVSNDIKFDDCNKIIKELQKKNEL